MFMLLPPIRIFVASRCSRRWNSMSTLAIQRPVDRMRHRVTKISYSRKSVRPRNNGFRMRLVSFLMSVVVLGGGFLARQHYQRKMIDQLRHEAKIPTDGSIGPFDAAFNQLGSIGCGSRPQSQMEAINAMLNSGPSGSGNAQGYKAPVVKAAAEVQANPFADQ